MGDQIDCCQRPANLGRKDLKTYRGINQKNNPKFKTSNLDEPDNFGSFKPKKNCEKNNKCDHEYDNDRNGQNINLKYFKKNYDIL